MQLTASALEGATVTPPFPAKETPKVVRRMDNPTFVRYHRGVARGQLPVDDQNIPPDDRETRRRSQGAESGAGDSREWLL
jgi:hypothetical protein